MFLPKNFNLPDKLIEATKKVVQQKELVEEEIQLTEEEENLFEEFEKYLDQRYHIDELNEEELEYLFDVFISEAETMGIGDFISNAAKPAAPTARARDLDPEVLKPRLDLAAQADAATAKKQPPPAPGEGGTPQNINTPAAPKPVAPKPVAPVAPAAQPAAPPQSARKQPQTVSSRPVTKIASGPGMDWRERAFAGN